MKKIVLLIGVILTSIGLKAQLVVADTLANQALIQSLAGPGLTISNVTVNCPQGAYGQFWGDNTNLNISEGILLTTGSINNAVGPNNQTSASTSNLSPGDADLNLISTAGTNDACVVEFDLVTIGDSLTFNYSFGSEEYLEFVGGGFNDVFAFYISGPGITGQQNIALIPGTTTPVSIDNVNDINNSTYYIDNGDGFTAPFDTDNQYIQYDGRTVVLQAIADNLTPCVPYHLKLAIADGGDDALDSGVFLEAGSFTSNAALIASSSVVDDNFSFSVEGCVNGVFNFTLPEALPTDFVVHFAVSGTATEGVDYASIPDSIIILAGDTTAQLPINVFADAISEGLETVTLSLLSQCNNLPYDSASLDIYDPDAYIFDVTATDFTGCVGSDATLYASYQGFNNFSWSPSTYLVSTSGNPVQAQNITSDITYIVSANLGSCVYTDSIALNVNPLYSSTLPPLDTSCTNGSVTLMANHSPSSINIVSYLWESTEPIANATNQTIFVSPQTTTDYILHMTSDMGCTVTDTITVEVLQGGPLVLIEPNDTLLCPGQSINLQATVYEQCMLILNENDSWGDGWNNGFVEIVQNGEVVAQHTLENGTSGVDTFMVLQGVSVSLNVDAGTFPTEMSYTLTYSDGTVITSDGPNPSAGNNVFTFKPNCGVPTPVYTYDWVQGAGLSATNTANVTATPPSTQTYIVNAEGGTCTGTGYATIKVDVPIYSAIGDTVCSGFPAQLQALQNAQTYNTCDYTLTLNSDFGWFGSSLDVIVDGSLYGTFSAPSGNAESFSIPVSNQGTIELNYTEPFFSNGETVALLNSDAVQVFSNNAPNNGVIYTATTNCPLSLEPDTICPFTLNMFDSFGDGWNGGFVTLNVNGNNGGTYSAAGTGSVATLELSPGDVFSLIYTSGNWETENSYNLQDPLGATLFSDGPTPATGTVYSSTVTYNNACTISPPDVALFWSPSFFIASDSTLPVVDVSAPTSMDFYLNYNYAYSGCNFTDTAHVEVVDLGAVTTSNDTSICLGQNIQLFVSNLGTGVNYSWTPTSSIVSGANTFSPIVQPTSNTSYSVTLTLGACSETKSINVDVLSSLLVNAQPTDTAVCQGGTVSLTAESGYTGYQWNTPLGVQMGQTIQAGVSGYYSYTFNVPGQCDGRSDSILLNVIALPQATINNGLNPVEKCPSDSVRLYTDNNAAYTYQWIGNSQPGYEYWVQNAGTYTVLVLVSQGNITCSNEFDVDVVNTSAPTIDMNGLENVLCCYNDTININPLIIPGINAGDQLLLNGQLLSGNISINDTGIYVLEVINSAGCNSLGTLVVNRSCMNPVINAPDTTEINQNAAISVSTTPTLSDADMYVWTPAQYITDATAESTTFNSDTYGNTTIHVEVSNDYTFGNETKTCTESADFTIFVNDVASVQFPNAFTPNGDGVNDFFGPVIVGNASIRTFVVYNRWGDLVYRYSTSNTSWDGSFESIDQPADVYVYVISVDMPDGTVNTYSGEVTLIY